MKTKWYISALIVVITLFGINDQQITVPNQEIVLQFPDNEVTSDEAQNAIAIVKEQLQVIGVHNIQVRNSANGQLKITYYSDFDVASVKELLSKQQIEVDYASSNDDNQQKLPSEKDSNSYNLDIYEIVKGADSDWDFDGIYVFESKPQSDRLFSPSDYLSLQDIDAEDSNVKVAYKVHTHIATAIDSRSYKIPEVRAGPFNA